MNNWKLIVNDTKTNLFPFAYWPDAYKDAWEKIIGHNIRHTLLEFNESDIKYYADSTEWTETGKKILEKIKTGYFGEKLLYENEKHAQNLWHYCEQLEQTPFELLNNRELAHINSKYSRHMLTANQWGLFISVMEYASNHLTNHNLEILTKRISEKKLSITPMEAFAQLSIHRKENHSQKEANEFNRLTQEYHQYSIPPKSEWTPADYLEYLKQEQPALHEKIKKHHHQYRWIRYNYEGPAFTIDECMKRLLDQKPTTEPFDKKRIIQQQNRLEDELGLSEDEKRIIDLTREFAYHKTMRRDVQSYAFFVFEKFQHEIARRFQLTLKDIRQLHYNEINELLEHGQVPHSELDERKKHMVYLLENGETSILSGKKATEKILEITTPPVDHTILQLQGTCAMTGHALGPVKIINKPHEYNKFKEGDIIVSFATTPDMISLLSKAAAIVTDQGGITCHAAIVSRELNIPCVIGTQTATQILQDGEIIEVDATNGIITRKPQ